MSMGMFLTIAYILIHTNFKHTKKNNCTNRIHINTSIHFELLLFFYFLQFVAKRNRDGFGFGLKMIQIYIVKDKHFSLCLVNKNLKLTE